MQEKLDAILVELESLKKQVDELEDIVSWYEDNFISEDYALDAIMMVKEALEFSDLDDIQKYTEENIIILHTNCFRTATLANAYNARARCNMHTLSDKELTPELLQLNISRCNYGDYIILKSKVFSSSDKFENIILDAISKEKVFFIICTNELEKIPESIREKMRVIK